VRSIFDDVDPDDDDVDFGKEADGLRFECLAVCAVTFRLHASSDAKSRRSGAGSSSRLSLPNGNDDDDDDDDDDNIDDDENEGRAFGCGDMLLSFGKSPGASCPRLARNTPASAGM
jgi:hypothetical protein